MSKAWTIHPNPILAQAEALMYGLGAGWLYRVHQDLHQGLQLPKLPADQVQATYPLSPLVKALDPQQEYSRAARLYRELLAGRDTVTPELYGDLVDAVTSKWAAEGRLKDNIQKRAAATYMLGVLESGRVSTAPASGLLDRPEDFLEGQEVRPIRFAQAKAGEYITSLSQRTRTQVKQVLYQHELSHGSPLELAQRLNDQFRVLNRDWRRIALTETSNNRAQGFLGSIPAGEQVEFSAALDCCDRCQAYHKTVWTVVSPEATDRDPDRHVWVGKTWQDGGAAISMHPHCRCRWMPVLRVRGDMRQDIEKRALDLLAAARNP
ncbi:hypothetical protein [Deinococcus cellulosilyticus]|uniref:Uncharacterized protein n=1 Tax=Deinococcus cellulosilyticus (strain DSM 18568 / NBRC 106333 / KACC 11606 / 5516J-15) TaxID=1223518 RepID=A0A511N7B2_DEIC1|nr:hypothetical protein [Deinococcus cellulosilyticus]GEM48720.1 hypothetical protein DC3_43550 [Deinococcus cellulosilyticus NBRC 106333 = KACC 11606]